MTGVISELELFDKAMEEAEKAEEQHKSAFRKTFDFLKRRYPPRLDDEYWISSAKDLSETLQSDPDNQLLMDMILCVYQYLSDIAMVQIKAREGVLP